MTYRPSFPIMLLVACVFSASCRTGAKLQGPESLPTSGLGSAKNISESNLINSGRVLIGSWLSTKPAGYRIIFLEGGKLCVTRWGTPYGGSGTWTVDSDELQIEWGVNDQDMRPYRSKTQFSVENGRLTFKRDVFDKDIVLLKKTSAQ